MSEDVKEVEVEVNGDGVEDLEKETDTGDSVEVEKEDEKDDKSGDAYVSQSELERRVNRLNKKHAEDLAEARKSYEREVKKERMSDAEREAFDLDEREAELNRREAELHKSLLTSNVKSKLVENEIPESFTDLLVNIGEEDAIEQKVAEIKADLDAIRNAERKNLIGQDEPRVENESKVSGVETTKDFARLSYEEKEELYNNNPNLYKRLNK